MITSKAEKMEMHKKRKSDVRSAERETVKEISLEDVHFCC